MNHRDLRLVFMGTPEFAVAPLEALYLNGFLIAGVVTVADKPAGRGRHVQQSAVKQWALDHNIPVLQPVKLKDEQFLSELALLNAQLFVVVAFRMLPEVVWKMPPLGTINLHASLLPRYRGAAPINHAVMNGESMTGLTTFLLDHKLDTGSILFQEAIAIGDDDTAGDLHDKMLPVGAALVVKTCEALFAGQATPVPQSDIAMEVLPEAPKIFKEHGLINWQKRTADIRNQIRGLSPYPAAYTILSIQGGDTAVLKIFKASIKRDLIQKAGTLRSDGKSFVAVAATDGWVYLDEVQLSGRKRMSVGEFLRGFPISAIRGIEGFSVETGGDGQ